MMKKLLKQYGEVTHYSGVTARIIEQVSCKYVNYIFTETEFTILSGFFPSKAIGFFTTTLPEYEEIAISKQ